jgi:hypothetical protein
MAATQCTIELKACDCRMVRNRIVSDDCPGAAWKPVTTGAGKLIEPAHCAMSSESDVMKSSGECASA